MPISFTLNSTKNIEILSLFQYIETISLSQITWATPLKLLKGAFKIHGQRELSVFRCIVLTDSLKNLVRVEIFDFQRGKVYTHFSLLINWNSFIVRLKSGKMYFKLPIFRQYKFSMFFEKFPQQSFRKEFVHLSHGI